MFDCSMSQLSRPGAAEKNNELEKAMQTANLGVRNLASQTNVSPS